MTNQNKIEKEIQCCSQIMQSMDNLYEEYARKNGLTYMSLYILETIYEQRRCTQKRISEITLYPKQTVNMVIRSFLEKGWVMLEPDKADRRNKYVSLTEEGEAFAGKIIENYWAAGSCAFSQLESQEREIMLRTLKTFADSFAQNVRQL